MIISISENRKIKYKQSCSNFLIEFAFDSLDNTLIIPDNLVFFLNLLLQSDPQILNGGRYLHLLSIYHHISISLLQLQLHRLYGTLRLTHLD